MNLSIRKASPADSTRLAELMNIAGEGIPAYLWQGMAEPGEDVMAFGARRVARTEGGFSYTNAHVATIEDDIAGILLGYRLPDPYDIEDLDEMPDVVRPLVELESLAPGSWYVNAVAVDSQCRGRGVGSRLMRLAEQLARQTGSASICLIVAEQNVRALKLYESIGYRIVARRPVIPFPGCPHSGDWVLMKKNA